MNVAMIHLLKQNKILKKECNTRKDAMSWLEHFFNVDDVFGYLEDGSFAFLRLTANKG